MCSDSRWLNEPKFAAKETSYKTCVPFVISEKKDIDGCPTQSLYSIDKKGMRERYRGFATFQSSIDL